MKFALIKNGKVENIIIAEQNFVDQIASRFDSVINVTDLTRENRPGVGWSYDGVNFIRPPDPVAPEPKPRDAILTRLELAKDNFETLTNNQKDVIIKDLIKAALHYIKAD